MNSAGILPVCVISFLIVCVQCEFSVLPSLSDVYSKIKSVTGYIPCKFVECCNDEYVSPNIDSKYTERIEYEIYLCSVPLYMY